jgi:hypothetical protein
MAGSGGNHRHRHYLCGHEPGQFVPLHKYPHNRRHEANHFFGFVAFFIEAFLVGFAVLFVEALSGFFALAGTFFVRAGLTTFFTFTAVLRGFFVLLPAAFFTAFFGALAALLTFFSFFFLSIDNRPLLVSRYREPSLVFSISPSTAAFSSVARSMLFSA